MFLPPTSLHGNMGVERGLLGAEPRCLWGSPRNRSIDPQEIVQRCLQGSQPKRFALGAL